MGSLILQSLALEHRQLHLGEVHKLPAVLVKVEEDTYEEQRRSAPGVPETRVVIPGSRVRALHSELGGPSLS